MISVCWYLLFKPLTLLLLGVIGAFGLLLVVVYLQQLPFRKKVFAFGSVNESIPLVHFLGVHLTVLESSKHCANYDVHITNYPLFEAAGGQRKGFFFMFMGTVPTLVVFRADHVEAVYGNSKNTKKGPLYTFLKPWLGEGLLTSHGSKWKSRRKFLTPAFHFKILETFSSVMNRQAETFIDRIQSKDDDEDVLRYIEAFTLDVVCETIMGIKMNCQLDGSGREYLKTIKTLSDLLVKRFGDPVKWVDMIYRFTKDGQEFHRLVKLLHGFTTKVINDRKDELLAMPETSDPEANLEEIAVKSKKPFLDLMLIEHLKTNDLTIEDIREEVDTFMFEGHDTTSMGLTWALYLIGLNRDVQEKLHGEIDRVFQGNRTCDVTTDHIRDLKYLEKVVKESQRIFPSVAFTTRSVTEEFLIDDKPVPVGSEVVVFIRKLHEDPDVFPKPHEFNPEHFSPENSSHRHPYAFVPFSAGPRNCIGQKFAMLEEKILLVWLLRKFEIKSLDQRDKILVKVDLVLRPQCPIRIALRKR